MKILSALFALFFCFRLPAQEDSIPVLPEVLVKGQAGIQRWRIDSLPLSGGLSLADRLLWESAFSVRSTGPGVLSTLSVRGAGPSRTGVFWQGINLQSPMNGVADLSLISLWPDDRVERLPGGQSALLSTGTMAGCVQISTGALSAAVRGWDLYAGGGVGSFSHCDGRLSLGYSGANFQTLSRVNWQRAANDFPFRNTALLGMPTAKQVYNNGEKLDFQQFNRIKINSKNLLETALWRQHAFREIPPSMTEARSEKWQRDRSTRATVTWAREPGNQSYWQHRLTWLDEQIAFCQNGATDSSHSITFLAASEYFTVIGRRVTLKSGLTVSQQMARADGYSDSLNWFLQRRMAGAVTAEYQTGPVRLSLGARQELVEGESEDPFSWVLGGQCDLWKAVTARAHLSRNFNLPTFNDRFWRNLGNPDLLPETGYSADAGLQWKPGAVQLELTAFHLLLDNWILWQPGPDGLFRPGNLRRVWSRGLEFSAAYQWHYRAGRFRLKGHCQFSTTTNTAIYDGAAEALNKQLPYTPKQQAGISVSWARKTWSAAYLHQWTGRRFTNSDNTGRLPGFQTANFLLQYDLSGAHTVSFRFRLENCWNAAYQIIEYRPMPGRSWHFGVELKW